MNELMEYIIFNGTKNVLVNKKITDEYEKYFPTVKDHTIECMILNEGCDENSSEQELKDAAEKGLEFDIYMATHDADEVSEAIKKGIIK